MSAAPYVLLIKEVLGFFTKLAEDKKYREEAKKSREKLRSIVISSHDTGLSLERYAAVRKSAAEVATHVSEVRNILSQTKPEELPVATMAIQFDRLRERLKGDYPLREAINKTKSIDRDDYDKCVDHFTGARDNVSEAKRQFKSGNLDASLIALENSMNDLERLVQDVGQMIDKQIKVLVDAYKEVR